MTFFPAMTQEEKDEALGIWKANGESIRRAAKASGIKESTFRDRLYRAQGRPYSKANAANKPRRHFIIPDTQTRPGVPLDHLDWVAKAIVEYKSDVIVHIGDHWDFPSLNMHEVPGSEFTENQRYHEDVSVGNDAFKRIFAPLNETNRAPRKVFCFGNHEARADTFSSINPKFRHLVSTKDCDTQDFERHKFGNIVEIDGILYSHFFSNPHSGRAIGGSPQNRLTKVGRSHVQGHVQGRDYGSKMLASGETLQCEVVGSCYLHIEPYRGMHQRHWRGVLILNEVKDGNWQEMPLSLNYLCKKYTGKYLVDFMKAKYPDQSWEHLL